MTIKTRVKPKVAAKPSKNTSVTKPAPKKPAPKSKSNEHLEIVDNAKETQPHQSVEVSGSEQPITGRGVFAVRTLGNAVSVEAAFLAQDGNVLRLPAVFPNREYALQQIDELRDIVIRHFNDLSGQSSS